MNDIFYIYTVLLQTQPEEAHHDEEEELHNLSDTSIVQMAKMHGTLHTNGYVSHSKYFTNQNEYFQDDQPCKHSNPPARIPVRVISTDFC